jgi:hypothetical protein
MDDFIASLVKPEENVDMNEKVYISNQWRGRTVFHYKARPGFKKHYPDLSYNKMTKKMDEYYDKMSPEQKAPFIFHAVVFHKLGAGWHTRAAVAAAGLRRRRHAKARVGWTWATLPDGATFYVHNDGTLIRKKLAPSDRLTPCGPDTGILRFITARTNQTPEESVEDVWRGGGHPLRAAARSQHGAQRRACGDARHHTGAASGQARRGRTPLTGAPTCRRQSN